MREDLIMNVEKMVQNNQKYLDVFEKWLEEKGLSLKTVRGHLSNADFYINDYLVYRNQETIEEGCMCLDDFISNIFIRKCLWSSVSSVKTTVSSIKKFYTCMLEKGYITDESYQALVTEIKECMDVWLKEMREYNAFCYDDWEF